MAITFSASLEARLTTCTVLRPGSLRPSLMFEYPTVSELVSHLASLLNKSEHLESQENEENSRVEGLLELKENFQPPKRLQVDMGLLVRHVVSLGTLCMTAQDKVWDDKTWLQSKCGT